MAIVAISNNWIEKGVRRRRRRVVVKKTGRKIKTTVGRNPRMKRIKRRGNVIRRRNDVQENVIPRDSLLILCRRLRKRRGGQRIVQRRRVRRIGHRKRRNVFPRTRRHLRSRIRKPLSLDKESVQQPIQKKTVRLSSGKTSKTTRFSLPSAAAVSKNGASPASLISCPICLETLVSIKAREKDIVTTVCGHIFCQECFVMTISHSKQCPTCRKKLVSYRAGGRQTDIYHPIFI